MGGELLQRLLADPRFGRVVSVGRRSLPVESPKLVQVRIDLTAVGAAEALSALDPPSSAFCCLGTTLKKAGSREAFREVDLLAVLAFARAARVRGAHTFVHVTALGADPRSRVFYNAVKGEVEAAVAALGFESAYALRPSILDGERPESRPAERAGLAVARLLGPILGKYRPTPASRVAAAMLAVASAPEPGVHAIEADRLPA